jgi:hypothetical protein
MPPPEEDAGVATMVGIGERVAATVRTGAALADGAATKPAVWSTTCAKPVCTLRSAIAVAAAMPRATPTVLLRLTARTLLASHDDVKANCNL